MRMWRTLFLISPLFLATILLVIMAAVGIINQGSRFDALRFFFVDNLDFSLAVGLVLVESIIALIIFASENQRRLSGKWVLHFTPAHWKGESNPRISGKGEMYLARYPHSNTHFVGYMRLEYRDSENALLHKGFYEIRVKLSRKRVTGQSRMIWGEGYGEEYVSGDPDAPYVTPCEYDLAYSAGDQMLAGEARMKDDSTRSRFKAFRV